MGYLPSCPVDRLLESHPKKGWGVGLGDGGLGLRKYLGGFKFDYPPPPLCNGVMVSLTAKPTIIPSNLVLVENLTGFPLPLSLCND